jgi:hypothetical protein
MRPNPRHAARQRGRCGGDGPVHGGHEPVPVLLPRGTTGMHHAFGVIGTALSKKISVFQSSSLKVVPISPNAWYVIWIVPKARSGGTQTTPRPAAALARDQALQLPRASALGLDSGLRLPHARRQLPHGARLPTCQVSKLVNSETCPRQTAVAWSAPRARRRPSTRGSLRCVWSGLESFANVARFTLERSRVARAWAAGSRGGASGAFSSSSARPSARPISTASH